MVTQVLPPIHKLRPESPLVHLFANFLQREFGYTDDGAKPPFTARQLIASGIESLRSDQLATWHVTDRLISRVVQDSFRYYRDPDCRERCHMLQKLLDAELDNFYSPFVKRRTGYKRDSFGLAPHVYTVEIVHGQREYALHGTRQSSTARFLDLPLELRSMVYEEVLAVGQIRTHWECPTFAALHQATCSSALHRAVCSCWGFNNDPTFCITDRHGCEYHAGKPNQVLAMLAVNRQIYREAQPVFYRKNSFRFGTVYNMFDFLRGIGASRRRYIHNVWVYYAGRGEWTHDKKYAFRAFSLLGDCHNLTSFGMRFDENINLRGHPGCDLPENFPGFRRLRLLRGVTNLTFENCPRTQAYLAPEMSKPKPT